MSYHRQPPLHDLVTLLSAPSVCLSAPDGEIRNGQADGLYCGDLRLVSALELAIPGAYVEPVGSERTSAATAVFSARVRVEGDEAPDTSLLLRRERAVGTEGMTERVEVMNFGPEQVQLELELRAAGDLAPVHVVRSGEWPRPVEPELGGNTVVWTTGSQRVCLVADPPPDRMAAVGGQAVLSFALCAEARSAGTITLRVEHEDDPGEAADRVFGPRTAHAPVLAAPRGVRASDASAALPRDPTRRRLLTTSLDDLQHMLLSDPLRPDDHILAAGSPWYFTLFGRDALWSALLLLPSGREVAAGTLRALRRRQAESIDPSTDAEPGKILHEVRRATLRVGEMVIPPLYYGTIDATCLWIRLLHAAWRTGMPESEVGALLPGLEAGLAWMLEYGDADGDGFIEYRSSGDGALVNQGWKDTPYAVRWAEGRQAQAPLALCEVQGYAYAAAIGGAELLEAFGHPGADQLRTWASGL
ncbi:MAG TPA: glycogen debranching N-terminal domain-containing protein, partial [Steroidobacteraceae bacterium]|nr:glycogen debranching N-terminal domain-containing protein [Steroidobacteraceae bacterium]